MGTFTRGVEGAKLGMLHPKSFEQKSELKGERSKCTKY
jgi:hypothetical protein